MTTPPLLALAAGKRVRARPAPKVRVSELSLHFAVVDLLRKTGKPEWRWSHYPSGELRDVRTAAKLKAMGTMPGWPDIIMVSPEGRFHGLELKAADGVLSDEQAAFQTWPLRHGIA